MKNVFVQCELWCDEILRRVARPCCTCSRHVSAQALADLAPHAQLQISPSSSRAFAPGIEISLTQCPSRVRRRDRSAPRPCPASKPSPACSIPTTSYLLYSTERYGDASSPFSSVPTKLSPYTQSDDERQASSISPTTMSKTQSFSPAKDQMTSELFEESQTENFHSDEPASSPRDTQDTETSPSYYTPLSENSGTSPAQAEEHKNPFWQSHTTMFAKVDSQNPTIPERDPTPSGAKETRRRRTHLRTGYSSRKYSIYGNIKT